MSCFRVRALFSAYIDEEISPSSRRVLERHLASCAACRRELDAWRALSGALRLLGEEPVAVPPSFRAGIMARLPARESATRRRVALWTGWSRGLRVAAAAAVLALLVGGVTVAAGLAGRTQVLPSHLAHRDRPPVVTTAPPAAEREPSGVTAQQPPEENKMPAAPSQPGSGNRQSEGAAPAPAPPTGEKPTVPQQTPQSAGWQVAFTSKTTERVAVSLWLEVPRLSDATAEIAALAQQYRATQKNTPLGPGADGHARMLVSLSAPAEDYETLLERLSAVGRETDRRITRTDVTSELTALNGELVRLKGEMDSLRRQGADVAPLEDRIRDVERKRDDLLRVTIAVWLTETGAGTR